MVTQVSGDLRVITSTPAKITSVDVRSTTTRPSGDGLMLGQWVTLSKPGEFNAALAEVDFPAVPGPAQVKLFSGGSTVGSVALIVPDAPTATLADCVRNAEMAGDRDVGELDGILEQIRESIGASAEARAGAEAAAADAAGSAVSAGRDAARAETAEQGAVVARTGAEAGQELSEDAAAVAVAAAVGAAEASSDKADTTYVDDADQALGERIDMEKWLRGPIGSDITSADSLPSGVHLVLSASKATELGLPVQAPGPVVTYDLGGLSYQRFLTQQSLKPQEWLRWRGSGGWTAWTLTDPPSDLWGKGNTSTLESADSAPTGWYFFLGATEAARLGLPVKSPGVLQVFEVGNWRYQVTMGMVGGKPTMWIRNLSSVWSEWIRIDGGGQVHDGGMVESTPSGMKVVPLALTLGGSGVDGPTSGSYRIPVKFGAPITRWRLCVTNRNPRFESPVNAAVTLNRVTVGPHAGNGHFASPGWADIVRDVTVPQDGSVLRLPWQTTPLTGENLISFQYDSVGAPKLLVGGGWSTTGTAAEWAPATTQVKQIPLDWWIEAETYATTPTIAVWGDSLSSGVGASLPVHESWLSIYCRRFGALPVHYSASGDSAKHWLGGLDYYKWDRWDDLARPDAMIVAIGSNDISGAESLADIQGWVLAGAEEFRRKLTPNVYAANIMPRTSWDAATEAERKTYNGWLEGRPEFRQVFDFASVVDDGTGKLKAEFDADQTHLTTSGYEALSQVITPVTAPPVMYQTL